MKGQLTMNSKQRTGLMLVKKPVQRAVDMHIVREATTGRVVVFSHTGNLPKVWAVADSRPPATPPRVEVAFYRKYTEAMLRRYLRMSTEAGRVPSLLGRELFHGNVTRCKVRSFEDVVIFCHDMEGFIAKLERLEQRLIARVALQQFSVEETAALLGLSRWSAVRLYLTALDHLTHMLLEAGMLEVAGHRPKSCQEVKMVEIAPTA